MNYKIIYTFLFFTLFVHEFTKAQNFISSPDDNVVKLLYAYPQTIYSFNSSSEIVLNNGEKIKYKKGGNKSHQELMNSSDLGDIFAYEYIKGQVMDISKNYDPGRIRSEELLKKMYGSTAKEVAEHLVTIIWCPNLVNLKLRITSINGVDQQLQKVSDELDQHPELKAYLQNASTFNWRLVNGTSRLSAHSFGTAIDLNPKYSNYWQWDCRCTSEGIDLKYKNRIPQKIVDIFEKHGFIWGGKWYHYDTMHFEYRPELLIGK